MLSDVATYVVPADGATYNGLFHSQGGSVS